MAFREFTDNGKRKWTVWDVYPTYAERRVLDVGPPPGLPERRRSNEPRTKIAKGLAYGWLAFEASDGERRRFAPVPVGWIQESIEQLCEWCSAAQPTPPARRMLE